LKKILNPFVKIPGYKCFGCSPDNPFGLHMEFFEEGDTVISTWSPEHHFSGYIDVLHGGIQSTLMDEIASWLVFVKLKTAGVTQRMEIVYKKPALTSKGSFHLKATLNNLNKRIAEVDVELYDGEKIVCATAKVYYFIYPEKIAKERLWFPGHDAFFEKEES
jgi:acyl-coenzyme A thioesterase PaaI-like protein